MNNKKSTKRALLSSVLSLVLCMAMLIGTTFAWFTDSVTSGTNKIVAGNLDVELYHTNGTVTNEKVSDTTTLFDDVTLWEPGAMVWEKLIVKNAGSLDLKYSLKINITDISNVNGKSLADVLKVAVLDVQPTRDNIKTAATKSLASFTLSSDEALLDGNSDDFYVAIYWAPSSNDNDYNVAGEKLYANLGVTLMATQYTSESDSFNNEYDKDALYAAGDGLYIDEEDGSYVALDTKGLSSAAALASTDPSITSVTLVTDEGEVEVPVVSSSASLDSAVANNNEIVVLTSGEYTVDTAKNTEVTIVGNGENTKLSIESEGEHNTDYGFDGSTVTFENLVFNVDGYLNGYARMNATYNNCIINGTYTLNGSSVFNNCTFNKTGDDYCIWTWGAPTAEFNDCTFNTSGKAILMYGGANTVMKLNNCVFNDNGDIAGKAAIEVGSDWAADTKTIIMTDCTVNGFDTTGQKNPTWGGTNLGTNVWGNKNLLPETRLAVTIDGQSVYGN